MDVATKRKVLNSTERHKKLLFFDYFEKTTQWQRTRSNTCINSNRSHFE